MFKPNADYFKNINKIGETRMTRIKQRYRPPILGLKQAITIDFEANKR